jgi:quercetin dioxygenase-like cupin family protein
MAQGEDGKSYSVQRVALVAAGPDVQVREFTVAPREEIPWHFHTRVTDWCYCLEGAVRAETRQTPARDRVTARRLLPGQSCRIDPGTEHRLTNGGDTVCRYLLVQGGGEYDFNKIEAAPTDPT